MAMPPVETLIAEVVATLGAAAYAYMGEGPSGPAVPDLGAAEAAIDVASQAFERIRGRLPADTRLAVSEMLTNVRMTFVRKRGNS